MQRILLTFAFFFIILSAFAQQTQVVRGRIIDKQSQFPLIGATVMVVGSNPILGTTADENGYYKIPNVPIGRIDLKITFIGYKENLVSNLLLTAGKEMVVNASLEESVTMAEEVVIETSEEEEKGAVENETATVSIRSFNVEETGRYAGSRNDPARMASNFAGVVGADDSRNDIIIRGNSPSFLLWRLDGLDVPNPNHYASFGSTGGPVSMLNNNVLSNSDFITSAFPAQYGNALSGVFDLKMRTGNREKHEFLGQIGLNGFELGAEGPIHRKSGATYLVNYRYSIFSVIKALGINVGTGSALPQFQDLSFKVDLPSQKIGRLSVFGMAGDSKIDLLGSDVSAEDAKDNLYGNSDMNLYNRNQVGALGISHLIFLDKKTYSKLIVGTTFMKGNNLVDSVNRNTDLEIINILPMMKEDLKQNKHTISYQLNRKFNARNTLTWGVIYDLYDINFSQKILKPEGDPRDFINFVGTTSLIRSYAEYQHRFSDKLTLNAGLYYQYLTLNGAQSIEPRLGMRYQITPSQSINLGVGRHSQMQPIYVYFLESELADGTKGFTNKNLDFTYSNHLVLGYDVRLTPTLRFKIEGYYQDLSNAPISKEVGAYSMLNVGGNFAMDIRDSLENKGLGRNYGVEMTLEKYFSNRYYFLLTTSLFKSEYQGYDKIWRRTVFDNNVVFNFLAGKEFKISKKGNLQVDIKVTFAGGRPYVPIDVEESKKAGYAIYDFENGFSERYEPYFRPDLKAMIRKNGKKVTQEYGIDIQNVVNRQNPFQPFYNKRTGTVETMKQLGMLPIGIYRITF